MNRMGLLSIGVLSVLIELMPLGVQNAWALPPASDVPEEVLRTEIITEARSPIDGKRLTAAEYAELQAQLRTGPPIDNLNPKVRDLIVLLRLRRLLRSIGIPIK